MLKVIVDGDCSHRPQFSRGVWGHAPTPQFFLNFEPSERHSETVLRYYSSCGIADRFLVYTITLS